MKTDAEKLALAKAATEAVLRRIQRDPRVAYYFDPLTDSFEKLTEAHAALCDMDVKELRAEMAATTRYEAPTTNDGYEG